MLQCKCFKPKVCVGIIFCLIFMCIITDSVANCSPQVYDIVITASTQVLPEPVIVKVNHTKCQSLSVEFPTPPTYNVIVKDFDWKEEYLWNYFMEKLGNTVGVACIIANFEHESYLQSNNLQNYYNTAFNLTDSQYTEKVNSGEYTRFASDNAAYGLAQWKHWSRKEALYNYAKELGGDVGSFETQVDFIWEELHTIAYSKTILSALTQGRNIKQVMRTFVDYYEVAPHSSITNKAITAKRIYNQYTTGV